MRSLARPAVLAALTIAGACTEASGPAPIDLTQGVGSGSERLLADLELQTPEDPNAAAVPAAWSSWMAANARPIRSLTSHRYDDLEFLRPILRDRRLVQLGESGHGVREFNLAKVRLIKFLHEEMGFDVIAFESGLFECWNAGRRSMRSAADTTMRRCLFGVWHTNELFALFDYIQRSQFTNRPLALAGFDVQTSSLHDTSSAEFFFDAIAGVDARYAARARDLEAGFLREYRRLLLAPIAPEAWRDSMTAVVSRGQLILAYDSLAAFLRARQSAVAASARSATVALIARQTAFSRHQFVRQLTAPTSSIGFVTRDSGMATNLDVLMDELYPGKRVIAWAHNAHVQHDRAAMTPVSARDRLTRSMGTWVSRRRRDELYSIGLFMYTGTAASNDRSPYTVTRPRDRSLEALFYRGRKEWLFVDLLAAPAVPGTEWMRTSTIAKEWGATDFHLVPRDQFDGILFVHTVRPPAYR